MPGQAIKIRWRSWSSACRNRLPKQAYQRAQADGKNQTSDFFLSALNPLCGNAPPLDGAHNEQIRRNHDWNGTGTGTGAGRLQARRRSNAREAGMQDTRLSIDASDAGRLAPGYHSDNPAITTPMPPLHGERPAN